MGWFDTMDLRELDGTPMNPDALAGKGALFVNVASHCGYTPQYKGLVALQTELAAMPFTVIGVPCNQFGAQEPGGAGDIATFCETHYGVNFPLLEKQDVNGTGRSALYRHLVGDGADIRWNFEKFLVNSEGQVVKRWGSGVRPEDPAIREAIAELIPG